MSQDILIRPATLADAGAIANIYNESIDLGDATMDGERKSGYAIRAQMRAFTSREGYLVLAEAGTVVGWGIIKRYSDRAGYRYACETSVYLRRSHVRRGLGSQMKRALIDRCKALGYHHLVAKIFATNTGSIAYNQELGYEMVGIQREIGFKNGHWQDIAIMQLVLADVPPSDVAR